MARTYATPAALRTALEERLRGESEKTGVTVQRLRYLVVFERFVARLHNTDLSWAIKGGYAMELRINRARTTNDVDLSLSNPAELPSNNEAREAFILATLQAAATKGTEDHFVFRVEAATQDIDGAPYGGKRFPVEAHLDGRLFQRFSVDVAIGDPPKGRIEQLSAGNRLGFAGIASPLVPVVSSEQQFAEKIHAYTLPREGRLNSRVKDLVDMALLARESLRLEELRSAIETTFSRRTTHPVPLAVPNPPENWAALYAAAAAECGLDPSIDHATREVARVLDPILAQLRNPAA